MRRAVWREIRRAELQGCNTLCGQASCAKRCPNWQLLGSHQKLGSDPGAQGAEAITRHEGSPGSRVAGRDRRSYNGKESGAKQQHFVTEAPDVLTAVALLLSLLASLMRIRCWRQALSSRLGPAYKQLLTEAPVFRSTPRAVAARAAASEGGRRQNRCHGH